MINLVAISMEFSTEYAVYVYEMRSKMHLLLLHACINKQYLLSQPATSKNKKLKQYTLFLFWTFNFLQKYTWYCSLSLAQQFLPPNTHAFY